ncbi:MAG: hypothetical protein ACTH9T_08280 [Mycetocola reblochoni]|uniref:Uncharacterized protein n=2 Tax=Mycetocola reblochoni TaxID=331618 RepID=A0A1R4JYP9_9MICO|nr:hypothetical protein [Mycetocola reblochoni]RLP67962.1 hypothetical protein D9V30_11670 [Mycetocola reblochoni]SJN37136.1 hypothetical protein FM119_10260 [Mycetocola reblochoni REB411]
MRYIVIADHAVAPTAPAQARTQAANTHAEKTGADRGGEGAPRLIDGGVLGHAASAARRRGLLDAHRGDTLRATRGEIVELIRSDSGHARSWCRNAPGVEGWIADSVLRRP